MDDAMLNRSRGDQGQTDQNIFIVRVAVSADGDRAWQCRTLRWSGPAFRARAMIPIFALRAPFGCGDSGALSDIRTGIAGAVWTMRTVAEVRIGEGAILVATVVFLDFASDDIVATAVMCTFSFKLTHGIRVGGWRRKGGL